MTPSDAIPTVHVIDDAAAMWQAVIDAWRADPDSTLLVANDAALVRLMTREDLGAIEDARIITMGDVIERVRTECGLPTVGPEIEMQVAIANVLSDPANPLALPAPLRDLAYSDGAIDALIAHLKELDERARDTYVPTGEIEEGVWRIRTHLIERGHAAGALRAQVSRAADQIDLGRRMIVPLTRLSRYHGMLLSGLAIHQAVDAWLLASPTQADAAIVRIFADDPVVRREAWTDGHRSAALFAGEQAGMRPRVCAVEVDHEGDAAFTTIAAWIDQGIAPSKIALVSTAPPDELERLATSWNVPLRLWRNVFAPDTPISATLTQIAATGLRSPAARAALQGRVALPINDEQLAQVLRARDLSPLAEIAALRELGDVLLLTRDITQAMPMREAQWLASLERTYELLADRHVDVPSAHAALTACEVAPRLWGDADGVSVLGWGELGAGAFTHVVYTGLSDYPPPPRPQPFLSPQTRAAHPELADADRRPELVAALALCGEEAVAVREVSDAQGNERPVGIFFTELARIADATDLPQQGESHRRALRRFARLRQAAAPEIVRAAERAFAEGRPARLASGKEAYSITELELYLRCPYGWFVQHVLRPERAPSTPAARRGQVAHQAMEQLLLHGGDPQMVIPTLAPDMQALDAQILGHQLTRVLARYAGEAWPFSEHYTEREITTDDLISGRRLIGRLDRIDVDPDHLLVIDYKSRRAPQRRRPEERPRELQRYLYPQMAAAEFGLAPAGALLVSLFHADHEGSLAADIEGLVTDAVDLDFDDDAPLAVHMAESAIEAIELARWDEVGHACPDFCPHHLISPSLPLLHAGYR